MNPATALLASHRISSLASQRNVHAAFQWLHLQQQRLLGWQLEMLRIPAPPFKEERRAEWVCERFRDLGLRNVHIDGEGNAIGELLAEGAGEQPGGCVLLSAHLDTVFPEETLPEPRIDEGRIHAPGACDNTAGLTGLLAIAAALQSAGITPPATIVFAANVGEEAEGNLRGMRHLFLRSEYGPRIAATICLEGAGTEGTVTRGIGSRRLQAAITGPGGHSWTDASSPNPIFVMSRALAAMSEIALPTHPRTTLSVGRMEGGIAVNSIPERASALLDLRSLEADELITVEVQVHRALEDAVIAANARAGNKAPLALRITTIGDRPAGSLPESAEILASARAVDRHLRLRTELRAGSTDANIPLALGRQAIAIGTGGAAGGIHTHKEWYDPAGRELALRRILLILLDCCNWVGL